MPLAVPRSLGTTVQLSGRSAWARFTSRGSRPMLSKKPAICASISGCRTSLRPEEGAKRVFGDVVLGRAQSAGDQHHIGRSPSASASRISCRSSPMVSTRLGRMPMKAKTLAHPPGVGVDRLADEQLIADADDRGCDLVGHGEGVRGHGAPTALRAAKFAPSVLFLWIAEQLLPWSRRVTGPSFSSTFRSMADSLCR